MKIYLVQHESNDDGQIFFFSTPCASMEIAQRTKNEIVKSIIEHHPKFKDLDIENPSDEYEVDIEENSININLPYDDYYEFIYIEVADLKES